MNMMMTSSRSSRNPIQETQHPEAPTPFNRENRSGSLRKDDSSSKITNQRRKNPVFLEGYVEGSVDDVLSPARSLTDDDLEELRGCLDLGFGFSYDEIPELCNTLPALGLCYSMSQKFLDDQQKSTAAEEEASGVVWDEMASSPAAGAIASWKISSPGDDSKDVKARLKYWAQTVAFTVKLCN